MHEAREPWRRCIPLRLQFPICKMGAIVYPLTGGSEDPCIECIQDLAQGLAPGKLSSTLAVGILSNKLVSLSTLHAGVLPKAFNNHQSPG